MTRKRRVLKGLAIALPVIFLLAAAPAFFPGGRTTQGGSGLEAGTQVSLMFINDTGVEVCGLQVKFDLSPAEVLGQIESVTPFKSTIPMIEGNVLYFSDSCLAPERQVELKLAGASGIAVVDYIWVRDGVLIPGTSPIEQLVQTVALNKLPLMKEKPEEPSVLVRFGLHNPPYGKLLVAQGDTVYENGLIAIKDQPRRDELLSQLADVRRDRKRLRLEEEIAELEVRAPVNGLIKELEVEMADSLTRVTLKILQTASQG